MCEYLKLTRLINGLGFVMICKLCGKEFMVNGLFQVLCGKCRALSSC